MSKKKRWTDMLSLKKEMKGEREKEGGKVGLLEKGKEAPRQDRDVGGRGGWKRS